MMLGGANMIWKTQEVLHHKNSQVVPGVLMLLAGSLIVYRHMTTDAYDKGDPIKTFLGLILIQMLPLVILECKIMSSADPVGLFCKFGAPVTLMHALFTGVRATYKPTETCNILGLVGALITLHVGFKQSWSPKGLMQHTTVWRLAIMACMAAACTEGVDCIFSLTPPKDWQALTLATVKTTGVYLELTAFVPAVWMLFREGQTGQRFEVDGLSAHHLRMKAMATAFFLFLVGFYIMEDLYSSWRVWSFAPLASVAHVAHFGLLLDFAVYILAHVYNPEKLVGELQKWLPVDISSGV
jgi:hypothetical protein